MIKLKDLFTGNDGSAHPLPWFNSGGIFSLKEEKSTISFPPGFSKKDIQDVIEWRERILLDHNHRTFSSVFIYQIKFGIIYDLDGLKNEFQYFRHHEPPFTFDMFMVHQIRKWLIKKVESNGYFSMEFDLVYFFDERVVLRNVLIPFFSRPTDEVVKTTPEQWEAVITEIKLLML